MWKFTEWQLQAKPREAGFLVLRVIHLQVHYLLDTAFDGRWTKDKSEAITIKDRDHCYSLARAHKGLMIMEVAP